MFKKLLMLYATVYDLHMCVEANT